MVERARGTSRSSRHGAGNPFSRSARRCAKTCCAFLLATGAAGDPILSASEHDNSYPVIRQKTVNSSKLRLVYLVGVEGTGHHFLAQVFRTMYLRHPELPIANACSLGSDTFLPHILASIPSYTSGVENIRSELAYLKALESSLPDTGTITTVQLSDPREDACPRVKFGMLSFPDNAGPDKALQYPDLRTIADLAEEEGVDLRIVYLQRPAHDLMISNVVHRSFHHSLKGRRVPDDGSEEAKFLQYAHIMLTNIAVVQSMLSELGPEFVVCHRYNLMDDPQQAETVGKFVSPSDELARYFVDAALGKAQLHADKREEMPFPNADVIIDRLQQKLDAFESLYCDF